MTDENNEASATTDVKGVSAPAEKKASKPQKEMSAREAVKAAYEEEKQKLSLQNEDETPELEEVEEVADEDEDDADDSSKDDKLPDLKSSKDKTASSEESSEDEDDKETPRKKAASKDKEIAPVSWSKEGKSVWETLPLVAQKEIMKREADVAKGVEKLKESYKEIEEAVSPYKPMIQSMGKSPGAAVKNLFEWHMALAGPNKKVAIAQLAANAGIDLRGLVDEIDAYSKAQQEVRQPDIAPEIRPVLDQYKSEISNLNQKIRNWEQQQAQQQQAQTDSIIDNWAKDKPYFTAVREIMGHLIDTERGMIERGASSGVGFIKNGNVDLDAVYNAAIRVHPEIRDTIGKEEEARREQERLHRAKSETSKAKKASVSLRPAAPTAMQVPNKGKPGQVESVRESIMRAMTGA